MTPRNRIDTEQMFERPKKRQPCEAWQFGVHHRGFACRFDAGHGGPHIDPTRSIPWGEGPVPQGMRRRGYTKYTNPKLVRRGKRAAGSIQ